MDPEEIDWAGHIAERFGDRGLQIWKSPARDLISAVYTILSSLEISRTEYDSFRALKKILSTSDGSHHHDLVDILSLRDAILYTQPPGNYNYQVIGKGLYSQIECKRAIFPS